MLININLKISFILSLSLFFISCNQSEIQKIGLDNRAAQKKFQDSIIIKENSNPEKQFESIRNLIISYKGLESDKLINNSNYIYYLTRLYSTISDIPLNFFYDSSTKKMLQPSIYKNMYDSAIFYSMKMIDLNPNNSLGYYFLAENLFYSWARYVVDTLVIPYPFKESSLNSRKYYVDLLRKNISNIYQSDTTMDKYNARFIEEVAAIFTVEEYAPILYGVPSIYFLKKGNYTSTLNFRNLSDSQIKDLENIKFQFSRLLNYDEYIQIVPNYINLLKYLVSSQISEGLEKEILIRQKIKEDSLFYSSGNGFFENHTFNSGTWSQIIFKDDKIKISLENYYNGANRVYTIEGTYQLSSNNSINIKWMGSNTISFKNIRGATCGGLQEVNQSYIFSDFLKLDKNKQTFYINCTFKQTFSAGTRCGNEDKLENSTDGFEWTLTK